MLNFAIIMSRLKAVGKIRPKMINSICNLQSALVTKKKEMMIVLRS